jgi:hypothetical protein
MGSVLILIGTLGFLAALVMLSVRLFAKKGWTYRRIAALAVAAVIVGVVGAAISPASQEGYKDGVTANAPAAESQLPQETEMTLGGSAPVVPVEKITVEKKPASSEPKPDQAAETLEQAARKELGHRLKYVSAQDILDAPGTKNIQIHFRASSELRKAMLADSADVFERLFSAGVPIHEAVTFIYWDVADRYGNKPEDVVMKVYLTGETAQKINWENINRYAFDQVADDIWEIPALRQ